ncbi:hypothetical protein [Sandaracinus amylolyticus]|uniref:Uncharacterized protein n=1 Tax=Sandaracinus amylolyticus TaxID=927083 RepID=A0A0F6YKG6_9BACT|nr:hypothetical protein [Sandaracinus amylolyticus]AKF08103.1 hypothetical protein DB32_005252 [Sandaracinus amylolyticus]
MSEERRDRDIVVPEPTGTARAIIPAVCFLWLLVMIAIPLRYYRGGDRYDERFSWRMFSAVRVARCQMRVSETQGGSERPIPLGEVLPAPWMALLERNRMPVVESFLRWRCETREGLSAVRFHNECTDPAGGALPSVDRTIDCASGELGEGAQ